MSNAAPLRTAAAKPAQAAPASVMLQRKCACGAGASGLIGECEECSKKKMAGLQTKLRVNEPGDVYEQEADRVAEQVMAKPAHPAVTAAPPRIQRLTRQSNGQADAAPSSVDRTLASPGRPLEPALRQDMEQRFGHDFGRVRVHSGVAAEQSAQDVNANAYTVGHNIVFGSGRFVPGTYEGRLLLAHELTHVMQQSGGVGVREVRRQPQTERELTEREPRASTSYREDMESLEQGLYEDYRRDCAGVSVARILLKSDESFSPSERIRRLERKVKNLPKVLKERTEKTKRITMALPVITERLKEWARVWGPLGRPKSIAPSEQEKKVEEQLQLSINLHLWERDVIEPVFGPNYIFGSVEEEVAKAQCELSKARWEFLTYVRTGKLPERRLIR
jgi:hypothetical protein